MPAEVKFDVKVVERKVSVVVRKTIYDIQAQMIDLLRAPKTGRIYRRRRRSHQASAPGEAPAIASGGLLSAVSQSPRFPSPLIGEISIPVEYAEALEFGAPASNLDPRPFVRPAVNTVLARLKSAGIISSFERVR